MQLMTHHHCTALNYSPSLQFYYISAPWIRFCFQIGNLIYCGCILNAVSMFAAVNNRAFKPMICSRKWTASEPCHVEPFQPTSHTPSSSLRRCLHHRRTENPPSLPITLRLELANAGVTIKQRTLQLVLPNENIHKSVLKAQWPR